MSNATVTNPEMNDPEIKPPEDGRLGPALRRELRRRLLALPYRAFLRVTIHLLHAQGYTAARPAGRDTWKGRNTAGGWDAEADFTAGSLGTLRCVAQIKQFDALTVAQRHVDELRGVALRAGASQAVLITLSAFSPPARKAAQAAPFIATMRLIDGEELLDLLADARLGVRRGRNGAWALDDDYFAELHRFAPLRGTSVEGPFAARRTAARNASRLRALSVTVRLDPPDGFPAAGKWRWEADMKPGPDTSGEPL